MMDRWEFVKQYLPEPIAKQYDLEVKRIGIIVKQFGGASTLARYDALIAEAIQLAIIHWRNDG